MKPRFLLKRVYDAPEESDGRRVLVERLWPRGIKKVSLKLDAWPREIAPSTGLRKWFGHEPEKWDEFQRRYRAELEANPEPWSELLMEAKRSRITLLFSSHDVDHNNAVALRSFLEEKKTVAVRRTSSFRPNRRGRLQANWRPGGTMPAKRWRMRPAKASWQRI